MKSFKYGQNLVNSIKHFSTNAIPPPHLNPKLPNRKLFINNEWVDSLEPGNYFTPINPTTEQVITEVQAACKSDLDRAVEAARQAFHRDSPWRKMAASDRANLILKLADLLERDKSYIASLETLEVGKIYSYVYAVDLTVLIQQLRTASGMADKVPGHLTSGDGEDFSFTRYEPVGVCGLITAWNFPTVMAILKLSHTLATGNVAVIKPSQNACFPALHLAHLAKEAGFPPGVINVVPGTSAIGQGLSDHTDIDLVTVTSSTDTGRDVFRRGASNMKKLVMELGGKSPIVIFDDFNLDTSVQQAHTAIMHNAGQCCCAASITYVQDTIFEEFVRKSKELTSKRKIGNPFDPTVMHGPQGNENHLNSILRMVQVGQNEGALLEYGGVRINREGLFMEPAIFTNVKDDMTITREEIFGPVQLIIPFNNLDEVIERVNSSKFGLASAIFSNDINKVNVFTQQVRTGTIWVNCYFNINLQAPFGGYKMSGIQREGGVNSFKAFMKRKNVQL